VPTFGNDPQAFIRHNLLTLDSVLDDPAPGLLRTDGTVWVTLEDVTAGFNTIERNRNRKGLAKVLPTMTQTQVTKTTRIYKITKAEWNNPDGFPAYICPYADNTARFKTLGSAAAFMFTGDMDGCTFGIGIPNSSGGVRVGHSNARDQATGTTFNPNFAPQRAAQQQDLVNGGTGASVIDPNIYRNSPAGTDYRAVTIGLRIGDAWEFWYQHQNVDGCDLRSKLATTRLR
jgi:hypothetical protein